MEGCAKAGLGVLVTRLWEGEHGRGGDPEPRVSISLNLGRGSCVDQWAVFGLPFWG